MTQFSETLMDYFQSPRNQGRMEDPDCVGTAGIPGQGRYIQLFIKLADGRVSRMQFDSYGCGVTIAVCSLLTEMTEARSREECASIHPDDIAAALDGIPPHKMDCAHFAVVALQNALQDWPSQEAVSSVSRDMKT
jgi:nitrogen fixation NifU-like protein